MGTTPNRRLGDMRTVGIPFYVTMPNHGFPIYGPSRNPSISHLCAYGTMGQCPDPWMPSYADIGPTGPSNMRRRGTGRYPLYAPTPQSGPWQRAVTPRIRHYGHARNRRFDTIGIGHIGHRTGHGPMSEMSDCHVSMYGTHRARHAIGIGRCRPTVDPRVPRMARRTLSTGTRYYGPSDHYGTVYGPCRASSMK